MRTHGDSFGGAKTLRQQKISHEVAAKGGNKVRREIEDKGKQW
ncbi:uncharacterized protein G2W53_008212 [Senna tora]|uniref:Uncharacterized protein n=1 Tax=Senna tora TaxID=362788 RepID=A0A835CGR7_9FABA|nr:uncharacterized protein G2W53_008212 [Senna tora]